MEKFITGNEAVVLAAKKIGAKIMCGYPITPATELLQIWVDETEKNKKLKVIQSEDETSAGFNTIGAILAGKKAFTATAGPGHILMQDPIAMAEAMRLPFVGIIMQRGGPSTGTVVYGQQEITMAAYGGNGEGHRVVYSTSNPQDLYDLTIEAFNTAWKYRLPTFVLGDGYQSKMVAKVILNEPKKIVASYEIMNDSDSQNIRNCFNIEPELAVEINKNQKDYQNYIPKIVRSEQYLTNGAKKIIVAHGIVANAAKQAVDILRSKRKKIGLFRPITIKPLDFVTLSNLASKVDELLIVESSLGHFERIIRSGLYGLTKIKTYHKPVETINAQEIIKHL